MPLHARPIAVGTAVIFFFGISVVGCVSGLSPFTCCKRALAGAALAYFTGRMAVKAVNAILIDAMIANRINRKKEKDGGSGNQKRF
ncbi:MAG: hypothetical protein ACYS76_00085 [Planctomycetota bacterium]|jgi:biotin transporter BioY